jgi:hypothetical protein
VDRSDTPGYCHRRPTPFLRTGIDRLQGVCLDRIVELDNVRLRLRDWPGVAGQVVHIADPSRDSRLVERIAATLAPRYRVLSITPRADYPYQVHVVDLVGVLTQFGFDCPFVVAEERACAIALLLAAWYAERIDVRGLTLVDAPTAAPDGDSVADRAWRDCPPDWPALRRRVTCPVFEGRSCDSSLIEQIEMRVAATLP